MTTTTNRLPDLNDLAAYRPRCAELLPLVEAGDRDAIREAGHIFEALEGIAHVIEAEARAHGGDHMTDAYGIVECLAGARALSVAHDAATAEERDARDVARMVGYMRSNGATDEQVAAMLAELNA